MSRDSLPTLSGAGAACLDANRATSSSPKAPGTTPCQPGTYQPSPGQAACLDAGSQGPFVQSEGAAGDEPCQPGTYQPTLGAVRLPRCEAGPLRPVRGPGDEPCQPGTYQPSPGQSDCLNASTDYYAKYDASISVNYSRSRLLLLRIEHDRSREMSRWTTTLTGVLPLKQTVASVTGAT